MIAPLPFENKIAFVTDSGRGIGRAIADVVVNYIHNLAPAEEPAQKIQALGRRISAGRLHFASTTRAGAPSEPPSFIGRQYRV